jgi:hypothetical protein
VALHGCYVHSGVASAVRRAAACRAAAASVWCVHALCLQAGGRAMRADLVAFAQPTQKPKAAVGSLYCAFAERMCVISQAA